MVDTSLIYTSRIKECFKNMERDFKTEWSNKKCKWFFKEYRQKKLRTNIVRRYESELEDIIDAFNEMKSIITKKLEKPTKL